MSDWKVKDKSVQADLLVGMIAGPYGLRYKWTVENEEIAYPVGSGAHRKLKLYSGAGKRGKAQAGALMRAA